MELIKAYAISEPTQMFASCCHNNYDWVQTTSNKKLSTGIMLHVQ